VPGKRGGSLGNNVVVAKCTIRRNAGVPRKPRHIEQQEATDAVVTGGGYGMAVGSAVLSRVIGTGNVGTVYDLHAGIGRASRTMTGSTQCPTDKAVICCKGQSGGGEAADAGGAAGVARFASGGPNRDMVGQG
jgi:hypothetical protein